MQSNLSVVWCGVVWWCRPLFLMKSKNKGALGYNTCRSTGRYVYRVLTGTGGDEAKGRMPLMKQQSRRRERAVWSRFPLVPL